MQVAPPTGPTISTHTLFSQPRFLPPPPPPPPHPHAPAQPTWLRGLRGRRGPWLLGTVELLLLVKMDYLMWNSANWPGFWFMAKWVLFTFSFWLSKGAESKTFARLLRWKYLKSLLLLPLPPKNFSNLICAFFSVEIDLCTGCNLDQVKYWNTPRGAWTWGLNFPL